MPVKVILLPEKIHKEVKIKNGMKICDLIEKININPDIVIALKNNLPIPIDSIVRNNDEIKIVRVVSGG